MVNSFANYYKNRLWRNEVAVKKDMRRKELKVKPSPVQAVLTCSNSSFPQEQMRLEADRALEEAEKVESLLDVMEEEKHLEKKCYRHAWFRWHCVNIKKKHAIVAGQHFML